MTLTITARGVRRATNRFLRPMLTFSFDDGYASDYHIAFDILAQNGIRGTFYVIGDRVDKSPHLHKTHIKEMADAGQEIGSHTVTHPELPNLTDEELIAELRGSKEFLQDITGQPVLSIAYPFGEVDERVIHLTGGFYENGRVTSFAYEPWGKGRMVYGDPNVYTISCLGLDSRPVVECKQWIDSFVDDCQRIEPMWFNVFFHRIYEDDDPERPPIRKTRSEFQEIVEYAAALKKQGIIDIVPVSEGARRLRSGVSTLL